ncbi:MAG TPA: VOC family protein [Microlunatus sp.]
MAERVRGWEFQKAAEDWRVISLSGIGTWFDAPSHRAGAALVRRIAEVVAEHGAADGNRPNINLRGSGVEVWIPDESGWTTDDVAVAQGISAAARDLGLTADPSVPQELEWSIDTLDEATLSPFWQTLLGYEDTENDHLLDPLRRDPRVWFYSTEPRPLRNRFHFDVAVPREFALQRAAEVTSRHGGGNGRGGEYAPEGGKALLADAEGNEVDYIPAGAPDLGEDAADWWLPFGGQVFYPTDDLGQAVELSERVAGVADDLRFPLMIDLRPAGVTIDTGKDGWEDKRFAPTAREVQAIARAIGLTSDPSRLRFFQVCIDAVDVPAVRAFWRAALGYVNDPREFVTDIYDPRRLNREMIFQQMDPTDEARREQRNRIHLDLVVPDDQVEARIAAALAAGGRLTREGGATIADPEGNEVDIGKGIADPPSA